MNRVLLSILILTTTAYASNLTISQLGRMPLTFTENQGQWDEKVLYRSETNQSTLWFSGDGVTHHFVRSIDVEGEQPTGESLLFQSMAIKALFVGSNDNAIITSDETQTCRRNYFLGNDHSKWATNVLSFGKVTYQNLYDGIDVTYHSAGSALEYDVILGPWADLTQVEINYQNTISMLIDEDGRLIVETIWGRIIEEHPYVYQIIDGVRVELEGWFVLLSESSFGFLLGNNYDPSQLAVIDPVLTYSSYLGGSFPDDGYGVAVDSFGCAYYVGRTMSSDFPTLGALDSVNNIGNWEAFVTKMSSDGLSIEYSTYLGGSGTDLGYGVALDQSYNLIVSGITGSSDFPIRNAYQGDIAGSYDAFVTKLNPTGDTILLSTYLGGTGQEADAWVAVTSSGRIAIAGNTLSIDYPVKNAFQQEMAGTSDGFVTVLEAAGNGLVFSSYYGGTAEETLTGIATDVMENVFIIGTTESYDLPVVNEIQSELLGETDCFVAKFGANDGGLRYGTYLGGSENDYGKGIAVDEEGAAYLSGETCSNDFPLVAGLGATYYDGCDVFVTKLHPDGESIVFSSLITGRLRDLACGIGLSSDGSIFVAGTTESADFPLVDAFQWRYTGGSGMGDFSEAYVAKLNGTGSEILYSSLHGGWGTEIVRGMGVNPSGEVCITGIKYNEHYPLLNAFQAGYNGAQDAFVAKILNVDCCGYWTNGYAGNTDYGTAGERNLADITKLIDRVYLSKDRLQCEESGNVNGDVEGKVNLADITQLIDHVYLSKAETAACQ